MTSTFQLDQINPLRGLRLPGLIAMQDRAMLGYLALLMWTYFFIEQKAGYQMDEKELRERTGMKLELVGRNGGQYA